MGPSENPSGRPPASFVISTPFEYLSRHEPPTSGDFARPLPPYLFSSSAASFSIRSTSPSGRVALVAGAPKDIGGMSARRGEEGRSGVEGENFRGTGGGKGVAAWHGGVDVDGGAVAVRPPQTAATVARTVSRRDRLWDLVIVRVLESMSKAEEIGLCVALIRRSNNLTNIPQLPTVDTVTGRVVPADNIVCLSPQPKHEPTQENRNNYLYTLCTKWLLSYKYVLYLIATVSSRVL